MQNDEVLVEAEARIAAHRMGDLELVLRDAAGAPLAGVCVSVALERHDFRHGANGFNLCAGGVRQPAGAMDEVAARAYEARFAELMNYATLPFYWGQYEPEQGRERTDCVRAMATWCRARGIRTKGHPLAWHSVFPRWAEALADAEVLRLQRERISRIVGAFRGLVGSWDVFNETTVATRFDNAIGRWVAADGAVDCVAEAIALARAADPDAELLYNDFNVSPAFEALLEGLQARGAAFDAIGIQSHMHKSAWSLSHVWDTCEVYARFGLPLHFTELTLLSGRLKAPDDNNWQIRQTDWVTTPEGEQRQLEEGRALYTLLFSHPAVDAVTWWDFSDWMAWQGAPAGLLREDMTLKPLAEWLREAFGQQWTTRVDLTTDSDGRACFRGFYGTYSFRGRTRDGRPIEGTRDFPRRGVHVAETVVHG